MISYVINIYIGIGVSIATLAGFISTYNYSRNLVKCYLVYQVILLCYNIFNIVIFIIYLENKKIEEIIPETVSKIEFIDNNYFLGILNLQIYHTNLCISICIYIL